MGIRRPRPPGLEAPLSASSVEMMDFTKIHLMSHNNRVREIYTEHARRSLVSPTVETTSPALLSVLNKWLLREMPYSRSCDEFSERLQIVLFTLRDPELNAVYNASADV